MEKELRNEQSDELGDGDVKVKNIRSTCNAVLRERVGNPKLANAIYTHGLPWSMQRGTGEDVSEDDILKKYLNDGVAWLKNVGQGLMERKNNLAYPEALRLGGKRKRVSPLEERDHERKGALKDARLREKRGEQLMIQRGPATIATEHVVMLPPTQVSVIK